MYSKKLHIVPLFALLAGFFVAASAGAKTVCVREGGGGGCESSIQDGVDEAVGGDTVEIHPGRYEENVDIPGSKDGLTVRGTNVDKVILVGDAGDHVIDIYASDVTLRNFTVKGGGDGNSGLWFDSAADRGTVRSMRIVDIGGDGGDDSDHCIYTAGEDLLVTNSLIYSCDGTGVRSGDGADGLTVRNSTIHGAGNRCISASEGSDDVVIENNDIARCDRGENGEDDDDACVRIDGHDATVDGNDISECANDGVDIDGDRAEVRHNDIRNADHDAIDISGSDAMVESNRIRHTSGDDTMEVDEPGDGSVISKNIATDAHEDCYDIDGDDVEITRNSAERCGSDGGDDCFDLNITNSLVEANTADHCADEAFDVDSNSNSDVLKNTAKNAAEDGFGINSSGNTVENNKAIGNENVGFAVQGDNNTLDGNTARRNRQGSHCDGGTGNDMDPADNKGFNDEVAPDGPADCPDA